MQLGNDLPLAYMGHMQIDLAAEIAQIFLCAAMVLGDDLVAGAVVAQRLTERNVHIKGQRHRHGLGHPGSALLERLYVIVCAKGLDEPVRRRVRRVARAGNVKTLQ